MRSQSKMLLFNLSYLFSKNFFRWFLFSGVFITVALADFHPTTIKDQVMVKQVYRVFNVKDWTCCILECQGDSKCSSYNFEYDTEPSSGHICELSECAMNEKREKGLNWRRGFLFQQLKPSKNEELCIGHKNQEDKGFNGLESSVILQSRKDPKYFKVLLKYLGAQKRAWKRCFHSGKPGLNAVAFHSLCDSKGPTVTIIRVGKYVFGGYIDVSWISYQPCVAVKTKRAFLFSLYNVDGFKPHKFAIKPTRIAAWLCSDTGPAFGKGYDMVIYQGQSATSYFRSYSYEIPPGCKVWSSCNFYTGTIAFVPSDIEVFNEV